VRRATLIAGVFALFMAFGAYYSGALTHLLQRLPQRWPSGPTKVQRPPSRAHTSRFTWAGMALRATRGAQAPDRPTSGGFTDVRPLAQVKHPRASGPERVVAGVEEGAPLVEGVEVEEEVGLAVSRRRT
jgi:hypothetical protein